MSTSIKAKKISDNMETNKNEKVDYAPIYKVNYMINNSITTIYVFNGKNNDMTSEEELFKRIFTETELAKIKSENIKIKFSNHQIHFDDSIGTIKIKILLELKSSVALDEVYLYCQQIESFTSVSVYKSLTQNKKLELTKVRLDQFISNIVSQENGQPFTKPQDKEVYTFDDILEMNLDNKKYIVNKVLGQKFFIVDNEYPYVCDPYDVKAYDTFFEKNARKTLSTLNSHLLLTTGDIVNNNIFLCLAKDVVTYAIKSEISEETTIKIYYPFLYNKNINDLNDLNSAREKLIENDKKIINEKSVNVFNTIDMFYDVYKLRKTNMNYDKKGIKFIKAVVKPEFDINIPLEVLFKIIHATELNPLIKYNPSVKQENVYRLFTDKISTDGRKIPYLKKAAIFKLMKTIGKNKSVTVYIETNESNNSQNLLCEFDENGYITIISEFNTVVSISEIDNILRDYINPIIEEIKNVLEQSGYKLKKFNSLHDENVEIKQLTYESQIIITESFDIDKYKGCLSTVFTNESNMYKSGINLRFKRVSNFSKVTSQEAFILEKSEQGYRGQEIIELLLENFSDDLDRKQAEDLVRKVANEIQLERGVKRSEIRIKENPGFKTTITLAKESGIITIVMENINDINYLYTIPIYLDTMVRLTQNKKSTKYPIKEINNLCSANEKIVEVVIPDIISSSEDSFNKSEIISLEDEEAEYKSYKDTPFGTEKPKGAFSLFYDEEDIEDEEDKYKGEGGKNSESESSIPSESSISSAKSSPGIESPVVESLPSIVNSPVVESPLENKLESFSLETSPIIESLSPIQKVEEAEVESETQEKEPQVEEPQVEEPIVEEPIVEAETKEKEDEELEEEADQEDNFRNIDGMKLNKPYYFQTQIEKKDPILILKEDTPQFNSYSRTCRSDMRRQPVILTDAQLAKINKEFNGFLRDEDVIKYGSDPKNQFNYICPRYWCLKTNTIIDPKDLTYVTNKDGKKELIHPTCGKVLSRNDKQVKPGHYIYEFYGENEKRYPGFQTDKHPDGYCLPCCFDKYNTEGRIKAKERCQQKQTVENNKQNKPKAEEKVKEEDEYIKGPDKFPLDPGRWGYLPVEIQKILHEVNADCQISKTNTNIKQDHPCLLRHGVSVNNKQSFVSCISDVLFFGKKMIDEENKSFTKVAKILTIKEMRERIIKAINIDSFIKYQNGNLVTDFHDVHSKVDINKYTNSKLYSKLNMNNEVDKSYYTKVISAYENFTNFMSDDDAIIDHTYLWDIICMPNKYLFPNGVNLVIFKLPHDDITNNVQLLCPTNHYSSEFYEARKPTLMMIVEEGYYEPIYSYTVSQNKLIIAKEFKEYDPQLSKTMRAVFKEIIKPFFNMICRPLESMPNIYKAKRPLLLYNLVQKLDKYEYKPIKLVVNFTNKVIGIIAEEPGVSGRTGFIPCYPSAIDENLKHNLDYVFMTDTNLWNTYENTVQFLDKLEKRSKKRREQADIPCKPAFKIIEDEHIVGILTETNQFIQLSSPIREEDINKDIDIPSIYNDNYIVNSKNNPMVSIDVPIATTDDVDKERVDYIKKIKLESGFYNVFRNTIRILLNDYENVNIREQVEGEMLKEYIIYSEKLINIDKLLRHLVKDKIQFIGDDNYYKVINDITTCIVKDKEKCQSTPNLCTISENGKCNLILPKKNLISGKTNENIYYGRVSDELIRYNRIKSFMLQPQTYLLFGNISYNLRENEIILIQSLLNQEYFETLTPTVANKYIKFNSYDETEPLMTQIYENKIPSLDHAIGRKNEKTCTKTINNIKSSIWKQCFPDSYKEIDYTNINYCTFNMIIDLIEKKTGDKYNVNQIKNDLYNEYKKYLDNYKNKILDILILEGKKTLGDQVVADTLSFINFIYTDNYFLTTFDLWLLVQKYEIPTIFISQKFILQTKYEKNAFLGYGNINDKFAFILIPGYRPENVPSFKLIVSNENDVFISLNNLDENCKERIQYAVDNKISINEYLNHFIKPISSSYEKKKPLRLKIDSESEEIKKPKRKLIIEETKSISPEEFIIVPKKKQTKKKVVLKGNTKSKSKKNLKKLIIEENSESGN
jgi:hypothetical protein